MSDSPSAVDQLHKMCGLATDQCEAALSENGGDVDRALAALIDAGKIKTESLDPDTVSLDLWERAAYRDKVQAFEQMTLRRRGGPLASLMAKLPASGDPGGLLTGMGDKVAELRKHLVGDKTAEQMVAEDEASRRKRWEEAKALMPDLKNMPFPTIGMQARDRAKGTRRDALIKANPITLNLPPFPPLELDRNDWKGKDVLSAWVGYYTRDPDFDDEMNEEEKANATAEFEFEIERLDENDTNPRPPAPEQVAAYAYLKDHQVELRDKIVAAFLKQFHEVRKRWLEADPDLELPEIETVEDMKENLLFQTFYMHPYAKDDVAYTGLGFACTWDEEHGAGVLLHKGRIVDIGEGEQAFRTDEIEPDGGEKLK
jgi:hypothetical protein